MTDAEALKLAQLLGESCSADACDLATSLFQPFTFKVMEPQRAWYPSGVAVYRGGAFIGGVEVRSDDDGVETEPMTADPDAIEIRDD